MKAATRWSASRSCVRGVAAWRRCPGTSRSTRSIEACWGISCGRASDLTRRRAYPLVVVVCALPRLAVLVHERGALLGDFEKSNIIARVFVDSGTFGYIPGEPTAYTQPMYAWFLIPIDWIA